MLESIQPYLSTYTWVDRRIIRDVLSKFNGKVLDVGCGSTRLREYLPSTAEYIGMDFNPAADIQLNISNTAYPFPDNAFDYVICNAVLEHVADEHFVLNEIYRVLKPGGTLYVSIPFLQPYHADPEDYRRFTTVGLGHVLQQHGFTLLESREAYGTLLTIEYLIFADVGATLKHRRKLLNPIRWIYLGWLFGMYCSSKLGNLLFYWLQRQDTYSSPGAKYLCKK